MSEETRSMLNLTDLVEPPMKPYLNPFPPKGKVYNYRFVKEVSSEYPVGYYLSMFRHYASPLFSFSTFSFGDICLEKNITNSQFNQSISQLIISFIYTITFLIQSGYLN